VKTRAALVSLILSTALVAASCRASRGAAPAAAQTVSTPQMTVTFASEPNPPSTGDNTILVTVKQPDGTPIADGNVTAVFSMPAMPSMNMPAMRRDATLTPQGNGVYRGTGQLSMAGTWSVALSVSRSGQPRWAPRNSALSQNEMVPSISHIGVRLGSRTRRLESDHHADAQRPRNRRVHVDVVDPVERLAGQA
jgi:hypothetical protein